MFKLSSDEIDKLTASFIEARKNFLPAREDAKANYGNYISKAEIKACTHNALLAYGLSLTQTRTFFDGNVFLETKLTHASGQWQASYVPLYIPESVKNIDQAYGAAFSYQSRYELYGLLGINGEDLDPDSIESPSHVPVELPSNCISDKQLGLLKNLLKSQPEREAKICSHYGIKDLSLLPWKNMNEVVNGLKPKE